MGAATAAVQRAQTLPWFGAAIRPRLARFRGGQIVASRLLCIERVIVPADDTNPGRADRISRAARRDAARVMAELLTARYPGTRWRLVRKPKRRRDVGGALLAATRHEVGRFSAETDVDEPIDRVVTRPPAA